MSDTFTQMEDSHQSRATSGIAYETTIFRFGSVMKWGSDTSQQLPMANQGITSTLSKDWVVVIQIVSMCQCKAVS